MARPDRGAQGAATPAAGTHTGGPHIAGPQTAGPRPAGPRAAGPADPAPSGGDPRTADAREAAPLTGSPPGRNGVIAYLAAGAILWLLIAEVTSRHQWLSDWWIHLPTVSEAARDWRHPLDPITGTDTPFPYYSPYTLALGQVVRWTGTSATSTLEVAGLLAIAAWLWALWFFVRSISRARMAPTLVLLLALFLWGPGVLWWSGFFSFGSLTMGPAWPSLPAGALMLVTLGAAWRWLGQPHWATAMAVLVLPGQVALIHPFTGVLTAIALTLVFLGRMHRFTQLWLLVAAGGATAALVTVWPYWSFWELLGAPVGFNVIHAPMYVEPFARYGLILVAVPALAGRLRRSWRDPLAWFAIVGVAIVLVGGQAQLTSLGRAWPLAMLGAHTALGIRLATPPTRWPYWVLIAVALTAGISGQLYGFLRLAPMDSISDPLRERTGLRMPYADASWIPAHAAPGDVVVAASQFYTGRQLAALGLYQLAPPWPDPLLPDEEQRNLDRVAILGPDRAARRAAIERWEVRWVVSAAGRRWRGEGLDGQAVGKGPDGSTLYRTFIP